MRIFGLEDLAAGLAQSLYDLLFGSADLKTSVCSEDAFGFGGGGRSL